MGSKMTPSLISEGGASEAPPMGATESDTPWEVGLKAHQIKSYVYILKLSSTDQKGVR